MTAWSTKLISIVLEAMKINTILYQGKLVHVFNSAKVCVLLGDEKNIATNLITGERVFL